MIGVLLTWLPGNTLAALEHHWQKADSRNLAWWLRSLVGRRQGLTTWSVHTHVGKVPHAGNMRSTATLTATASVTVDTSNQLPECQPCFCSVPYCGTRLRPGGGGGRGGRQRYFAARSPYLLRMAISPRADPMPIPIPATLPNDPNPIPYFQLLEFPILLLFITHQPFVVSLSTTQHHLPQVALLTSAYFFQGWPCLSSASPSTCHVPA